MRTGINERVRDVAHFTRKLKRVPLRLDHPVWVQDTHFDIEHHVHRLALPKPGGYAELTDLLGHLAGMPLDRSRPLWEMWVIEGCDRRPHRDLHQDAPRDRRRRLGQQPALAPHQPRGRLPSRSGSAARALTGTHPSDLGLLRRGLVNQVTRPLSIPRLIAPSTQLIAGSLNRARTGTAMAAPFSAPRTSFNGTITGHR